MIALAEHSVEESELDESSATSEGEDKEIEDLSEARP